MKYVLMIYGNEELWTSLPAADMTRLIADTEALQKELRASGEFVGAYGVGGPELVKRVTVKDGPPVVSDGPYLEAKEYLASFDLIDCATPERALEIAARVPFARYGEIEVRPLVAESDSN